MTRTEIAGEGQDASRDTSRVLAGALAWAARAAGAAGRGEYQAALLYAYHDLINGEVSPPRAAERPRPKG